ncbi:MAG TPA: hypothetical protein VII98_00415 [Solirubrobacteraceae bacterium]
MRIVATHFTDPGCPWAYSARPWHAALRWRFGDQLDWRLVMIGLSESAEQYEARGYTPERQVASNWRFAARFGMPFAYEPKAGLSATSPACRAVVAARLSDPARAEAVLRALQDLQFTTTGRLQDREALRGALAAVGAAGLVDRIDDPDVLAAYEEDRARARSAAGGPTDVQGRAASTDGPVRFTAPSVIFERPDGACMEVGGFQPLEAYDTALANLAPALERRRPAADVEEILAAFPEGLVTAEVAWIRKTNLGALELEGTRAALQAAADAGGVVRTALGDDARWAMP